MHIDRERKPRDERAVANLRIADDVQRAAKRYADAKDFLFIGRGVGHAVAMEGALKLKEISYIHAEGYAAGELKHGAIALIEEGTPVVAIAMIAPRRDWADSLLKPISKNEERLVSSQKTTSSSTT